MAKTYLGFPYIINFCNLTQTRINTGFIRNIRRVQQAPYPLIKVPLEELTQTIVPPRRPIELKPIANDERNTKSTHKSKKSTTQSSRSRKNVDNTGVNIARFLLNNLNIFGNKVASTQTSETSKNILDADSSSTKSGRRPSVDTVSTYLSHESKESDSRSTWQSVSSTSNLIDYNSDDVFGSVEMIHSRTPSIVGVDPASDMISQFVRVVEVSELYTIKMQHCPVCLIDMDDSSCVIVALVRCNHMMHLECLNEMLRRQQAASMKTLYIQCPVCMIVYGEKHGNQPPGSMDWTIIHRSLAGFPGKRTIQITYK